MVQVEQLLRLPVKMKTSHLFSQLQYKKMDWDSQILVCTTITVFCIQVKHGFDCLCNWWLPDLSLKIYLKLQELKMVLVTSVSLFHTLQLYTIFGITILKYNSSPLLADILFFINLVMPIF